MSERSRRRLSAIVAADVVGYSRIMGADEAAALSALRKFRAEVFGPSVAGHHGKIIKSMGDGWLVEFNAVIEAVNCALQIQERLVGHPLISLRIGVHIGDGVNVAARLEALAEPGGIAISDAAYSSLDDTLTPSFDDTGEQSLKNIERPMRVWVKTTSSSPRIPAPQSTYTLGYPHLSIQPVSVSDDRAEIKEIAEGLTGDLDAMLSAIRWLDAAVLEQPKAGGYSLRCGLRCRGDRLRLEARLFGPSGAQIWSGKFDGSLEESFDWQDETSEAMTLELVTTMLDTETDRLSNLPPENRSAEECLVHGFMQLRLSDSESFVRALTSYLQAMEKDPNLADAYGEAIWTTYGGMTVGLRSVEPFFKTHFDHWVDHSRHLGKRSPVLGIAIALADFHASSDATPLKNAIADALRRSPSDAHVLTYAAWASLWCGEPAIALDCFRKFSRFGKSHPLSAPALGGLALAALQTGDIELAIETAKEGLELSSTFPTLHAVLTAAHALSEEPEKAAAALARYRNLLPDRTISSWMAWNDYGGSEGGRRYFDGLRKAGFPE